MNADNIFELLTSYIDPVVILDVDNAVLCCLETKLQQKGQRFSRLTKKSDSSFFANRNHKAYVLWCNL